MSEGTTPRTDLILAEYPLLHLRPMERREERFVELSRTLERELQSVTAGRDRLREVLEQKSFHRGEWEEVAHIDYCDFCNYSRDYISVHGHGSGCWLERP